MIVKIKIYPSILEGVNNCIPFIKALRSISAIPTIGEAKMNLDLLRKGHDIDVTLRDGITAAEAWAALENEDVIKREMNEEILIEILIHDESEPDCDREEIQPVSAVLTKQNWLTGIIDRPGFIRLEYVIDTTKVTLKRI